MREAMGVHEGILQAVVEGDDDDDRTIDTVGPKVAAKHIKLLRICHARLGGWDKSAAVYHDLISRVMQMPEFKSSSEFEDIQAPDQWNATKEKPVLMQEGTFVAPKHWEFLSGDNDADREDGLNSPTAASSPTITKKNAKRPGRGRVQRLSSNWSMGLLHRFLLHDEGEEGDADMVDGEVE